MLFRSTPFGMSAVVPASEVVKPGVIFILKNRNNAVNIGRQNLLHPFYMVYLSDEGEPIINHLSPKRLLDIMRLSCKGRTEPIKELCHAFNKETADGRKMQHYSYLLQAYVTQENGRAKMGDVLYTGTPEKCRELMGQLKSGELTEGDVKQLYAKAQETAQTAGQDKDTFSIYQIKGGDETRDFRFEPYDRLQAAGNVVDRANYELVYSAPLAPETSLEDIYTCFNIDHPKDFKGHSLSVSDVVVLHQDGQDAAHFVDSVGFRQVPEFLQEQKQLTQIGRAHV